MVLLIILAINHKYYNCKLFIQSLFFQMTSTISLISFFTDGCVASAFIMVITYYDHMIINKINNHVKSVYQSKDTIKVHRAVKAFTEEHNQYCTHINAVNQFWKNLLLTFFVTMLPIVTVGKASPSERSLSTTT